MTSRIFGLGICLAAALFFTSFGCNSGGRSDGSGRIPNLGRNAEPLPVDNLFYRAADLEIPRYLHTATRLEDTRILVVGGSDAIGNSSLDLVEIFDQSLAVDPAPESVTGGFISTDANGDDILLINGGRLLHTATRLGDGSVLVAGGSFDIVISPLYGDAEVFDVQARAFNTPTVAPETEMVVPRFRHTATVLNDGRVLFAGGQENVVETVIDPNFPPGDPRFSFDRDVYPSTNVLEVYDSASRSFSVLTDDLGNEVEFPANQGRYDHRAVRIAGFDNVLGSSDDVILFAGGGRTFDFTNAPTTKVVGSLLKVPTTNVEFINQQTQLVAAAPGVTTASHFNGQMFFNVGELIQTTLAKTEADCPDELDAFADPAREGLSNIVIIHGGNDDANGFCPETTGSSQMIVCTFTGFGLSNGIQFSTPLVPQTATEINVIGQVVGAGCGVALPRHFADGTSVTARKLICGVERVGTFFMTTGGEWTIPATPCALTLAGGGFLCPMGPPPSYGPALSSVAIFDPFFEPFQTLTIDPITGDPVGIPPWDHINNETALNPTGVIGSWTFAHAFYPDGDELGNWGFIEGDPDRYPAIQATLSSPRIAHTVSTLAGEDGIVGTPDDRMISIGGGVQYYNGLFGNQPVNNTAEIYLPPNSNGF